MSKKSYDSIILTAAATKIQLGQKRQPDRTTSELTIIEKGLWSINNMYSI